MTMRNTPTNPHQPPWRPWWHYTVMWPNLWWQRGPHQQASTNLLGDLAALVLLLGWCRRLLVRRLGGGALVTARSTLATPLALTCNKDKPMWGRLDAFIMEYTKFHFLCGTIFAVMQLLEIHTVLNLYIYILSQNPLSVVLTSHNHLNIATKYRQNTWIDVLCSDKCRKRTLRQTLHVGVVSEKQIIQTSDWPRWSCAFLS